MCVSNPFPVSAPGLVLWDTRLGGAGHKQIGLQSLESQHLPPFCPCAVRIESAKWALQKQCVHSYFQHQRVLTSSPRTHWCGRTWEHLELCLWLVSYLSRSEHHKARAGGDCPLLEKEIYCFSPRSPVGVSVLALRQSPVIKALHKKSIRFN